MVILNTTALPFTVVGSAPAGATSFTVTGLTASTAYKFRVKAMSNAGLTDCGTSDVSVTTLAQSIPTDLTNLAIWLRAEDLAGNADGAPVNIWVDSSTNARQFTAGGANRPIYRASILNSFGVMNGI